MGYRAEQAYEKAQQKAFLQWKASLSSSEYLRWQWDRHCHFLGGAAIGGILMGVIWYLTR